MSAQARLFQAGIDSFVFLLSAQPLLIYVLLNKSFIKMPAELLGDYQDFLFFRFFHEDNYFTLFYRSTALHIKVVVFLITPDANNRLISQSVVDAGNCLRPVGSFLITSNRRLIIDYHCAEDRYWNTAPPFKAFTLKMNIMGPFVVVGNRSVPHKAVRINGSEYVIKLRNKKVRESFDVEISDFYIQPVRLQDSHTESGVKRVQSTEEVLFEQDLEADKQVVIRADYARLALDTQHPREKFFIKDRIYFLEKHKLRTELLAGLNPFAQANSLTSKNGELVISHDTQFFYRGRHQNYNEFEQCQLVKVTFVSSSFQLHSSRGLYLCRSTTNKQYLLVEKANDPRVLCSFPLHVLSPDSSITDIFMVIVNNTLHLVCRYHIGNTLEYIKIQREHNKYSVVFYKAFNVQQLDMNT